MMKRTIFATLGLAIALSLASVPQAHAGVVVGVGIGPVYAGPAYGYVVVHPRPYYQPYYQPYAYAPGYVYPSYGYGRFDRDRRWDRRDWDRRDWDRGDHGYRRDEDRREYRR